MLKTGVNGIQQQLSELVLDWPPDATVQIFADLMTGSDMTVDCCTKVLVLVLLGDSFLGVCWAEAYKAALCQFDVATVQVLTQLAMPFHAVYITAFASVVGHTTSSLQPIMLSSLQGKAAGLHNLPLAPTIPMVMALLLLHSCLMDAIGTLQMPIMVALFYAALLGVLLMSWHWCSITELHTAKEACELLDMSVWLWDGWLLELNIYHVMVCALCHYHMLHSTCLGALPGPA